MPMALKPMAEILSEPNFRVGYSTMMLGRQDSGDTDRTLQLTMSLYNSKYLTMWILLDSASAHLSKHDAHAVSE
jgi:hypothetical protein